MISRKVVKVRARAGMSSGQLTRQMRVDECGPDKPINVAFICQQCLEPIGDPLYRGPRGHAPPNICFTCWVNAVEQPPDDWPLDLFALWMMSAGYSRAEALKKTGLKVSEFKALIAWRRKNFSRKWKKYDQKWHCAQFFSFREGHHVDTVK